MAGTQRITAAGVIGLSAKPVRVFGYTMKSGAGGQGIVTFFDGVDATGTERWVGSGNADGSADKQFGHEGKFFAGGLFVNFDANVLYCDVDYVQVTS